MRCEMEKNIYISIQIRTEGKRIISNQYYRTYRRWTRTVNKPKEILGRRPGIGRTMYRIIKKVCSLWSEHRDKVVLYDMQYYISATGFRTTSVRKTYAKRFGRRGIYCDVQTM